MFTQKNLKMSDRRDQFLLFYFFGLTSGIALSSAASFLYGLLRPAPLTIAGPSPVKRSFDYSLPFLMNTAGQLTIGKDAVQTRLENAFTISTLKLHEIVKHFVKEMQRGLAAENQTLKMIPSYVVRRATGQETGVYLALDLGGSNFRVCEVFLEGKGQVRMKQKKYVVSEALKTGDGTALFDFFASSIREFYEENGIDKDGFRRLGFTFSFPCSQTSIDKGTPFRILILQDTSFNGQKDSLQKVWKVKISPNYYKMRSRARYDIWAYTTRISKSTFQQSSMTL